MIIKAGRYILNKTLFFDSSNGYIEGNIDISLPFTFSRVSATGITYTITCSRMYSGVITKDDVSTYDLAFVCDSVSPVAEFEPGSYSVYNENNGGWLYESSRIINVLADTEIDDESGDWFTDHTTETDPVLKGVYLFNEILIAPMGSLAQAIDFNAKGYKGLTEIEFSVNSSGGLTVTYKQTQKDILGYFTQTYTAYTSSGGWSLSRRVEIGKEQPVSKEFYAIFMTNVLDITNICALINYGDEQIAVLELGQRVRLPCTDKQINDDISITAPQSTEIEKLGYTKPEGRVTITENGTHDVAKFASAKVNVPVPEGYIVPSGTKTITGNGTHDVAKFASAKVNVPVPDGFIMPSGTKNINENGTYPVSEYASVYVDVNTTIKKYYGEYMNLTEES